MTGRNEKTFEKFIEEFLRIKKLENFQKLSVTAEQQILRICIHSFWKKLLESLLEGFYKIEEFNNFPKVQRNSREKTFGKFIAGI